MGLITVPQVSDGDTAEASDINTPVNTIANEFNGNIDNANIKSGAAIATSKLADDGGIGFAKLLSTIFSGQVTTLTNTGTAGGTMYYINLGGIKLLWGKTASKSVGNGGATWTVTLPTSFFSTVQASVVSQDVLATEIHQNAYISAISTTTLTIGQWSATNGSAQTNSFFLVGT